VDWAERHVRGFQQAKAGFKFLRCLLDPQLKPSGKFLEAAVEIGISKATDLYDA
jgi:hypothetical protein